MSIDKAKVRLHFDRHAREYERYAVVQKEMADRLLKMVDEHIKREGHAVESVLEIGSGTGYLTVRLAEQFPSARIVCVELSSRMIETAVARLRQAAPDALERITFIEADAEHLLARVSSGAAVNEIAGDQGCDLIISNAAFQWFNDPRGTVQSCLRALRPERGLLAFSTFGPGTFYQLHASFAEAERLLRLPPGVHGQPFAGRDVWLAGCAAEGAACEWTDETRTFVFPDVRTFLRHVKKVGAGNAMAGAGRGIGGRALLETMERVYEASFAGPGGRGIRADYRIGYGMIVR